MSLVSGPLSFVALELSSRLSNAPVNKQQKIRLIGRISPILPT